MGRFPNLEINTTVSNCWINAVGSDLVCRLNRLGFTDITITATDVEGNFAPLVGKIPVVRYLFGYEEKQKQKVELIILLKPRII